MTRTKYRHLLPWLSVSLAAFVVFALYFLSVSHVFAQRESFQDFANSFGPLAAFFTALAFFGLVITVIQQAQELEKTKAEMDKERNERIEAFILVTRLQTSGLRLISMSIEKDANSQNARRELEIMVEQFEDRFKPLLEKPKA